MAPLGGRQLLVTGVSDTGVREVTYCEPNSGSLGLIPRKAQPMTTARNLGAAAVDHREVPATTALLHVDWWPRIVTATPISLQTKLEPIPTKIIHAPFLTPIPQTHSTQVPHQGNDQSGGNTGPGKVGGVSKSGGIGQSGGNAGPKKDDDVQGSGNDGNSGNNGHNESGQSSRPPKDSAPEKPLSKNDAPEKFPSKEPPSKDDAPGKPPSKGSAEPPPKAPHDDPGPVITTRGPPQVSPAPVITTRRPPQNSPAPVITTKRPPQVSPAPVITTKRPPQVSPAPVITTKKPPQVSPVPTPDFPTSTQSGHIPIVTSQPPKTNSSDDNSLLHDEILSPAPSAVFVDDSHDIGDASKAFTSIGIMTTFVTDGVFTTDSTSTLPNGSTEVLTLTTSGTRTLTAATQVVTQIGITSSNAGPPKAVIGGAIGATFAILILVFVLSCLAMKRRRLQQAHMTASVSALAHPYTGSDSSNSPAESPSSGNQLFSGNPSHPFDYKHEGGNNVSLEDLKDPFRDPEPLNQSVCPEINVPEAGNPLDRLQTLTTQLEVELHRLNDLAQLGQLSDADLSQLNEIKRFADLAVLDSRARASQMSSTSTAPTYRSSPPSYNE